MPEDPSEDPLLLLADEVQTLAPGPRHPRAVVVKGDRISWVGDPAECPEPRVRRLDLRGAVLQPAFVNAHIHLTAFGLTLTALDLSLARSLEDCLAAVAAISPVTPGPVVWGTGWDADRWPERRPPTADELTAAGSDRPVLLVRADGHSVVIDRTSLSTVPLARASGLMRDASGRPSGLLKHEAARLAMRWFAAELGERDIAEARRAAAEELARVGYATVHEMGGPDHFGASDFDAWIEGDWPVEVLGWWGDTDLDFVFSRAHGRIGVGVLLDGTLGSHTAALLEPYADSFTTGRLYREDDDLVDFVVAATQRRVQVALHCIGDRAVAQAVTVLEAAAHRLGTGAVRQARHRLEHCTLMPPGVAERLAFLGVVACVHPLHDRMWGGPDAVYARRLGPERARRTNPFHSLVMAGLPLAFGADGPAAAEPPWEVVTAATEHHEPGERLDRETALRSATRGGRLAGRQDDVGPITPGKRADLAAFEPTGDGGCRCVMTMSRGRIVHGRSLLPT